VARRKKPKSTTVPLIIQQNTLAASPVALLIDGENVIAPDLFCSGISMMDSLDLSGDFSVMGKGISAIFVKRQLELMSELTPKILLLTGTCLTSDCQWGHLHWLL